MQNIIEIRNLKKYYGDIKAVDDISFDVREGELFAFLGQNGAGKSTTISVICGRLLKDGGSVTINGKNADKEADSIKSDIGVVFQSSVLDKSLTVKDNLRSRGALYGIYGKKMDQRIAQLNELLDLDAILNRTLGKLSGGQKRRIDIARALVHNPKILILDEPTTGLDPQTRNTVWSVVQKLQKECGMTVFLTTHYMEEAAGADNVIILDSGRIAAEGTPHQLKKRYTGDYITLYDISEEEVMSLAVPYRRDRDAYKIKVESTAEATKLITAHPEIFRDYEITKGGMDDVFLAVTGKKLGGDGK